MGEREKEDRLGEMVGMSKGLGEGMGRGADPTYQ